MKDELGEKIMTRFVRLKAKTYSYSIDDSSEDKKNKKHKKVCNKNKNYKNCLKATQPKNKRNYLQKKIR